MEMMNCHWESRKEVAMEKGNNVLTFKCLYLVYIGGQRDGPYKVGNCLYHIQDGEDPYPDPEKVQI